MSLNYTDTTSYLSTLINAGADAMTNLFYLEFAANGLDDSTKVALTIRNQDFTGPEFSQEVNTINFMTVSLDVPKSSMTRVHEISFTFRLDEQYQIYRWLMERQSITSMPSLGFAGTVVPDDFNIFVYALNGPAMAPVQETPSPSGTTMIPSEYSKLMYKLGHCWVKKIDPLTYKYGTDTPLQIKTTIGFMDYITPQDTFNSQEDFYTSAEALQGQSEG